MKPLTTLKTAILGIVCLSLFSFSFGQTPPSQLKKGKLKLTYQQEGGTNASAVTWHPIFKQYYAVIAGNETFPMESFNKKGKPMSQGEAGIDTRGLYYNDATEQLEGNGAGSSGYFSVKLGQTGSVLGSVKVIAAGMSQPDFQSVGTYDPVQMNLVFYQDGNIFSYDAETGDQIESIQIGVKNIGAYNATSIGCTGNEEFPFALLNVERNRIDFFDYEGELAASSNLPEDAVTNDLFWYSFTNGHVFLYDSDTRTWTGYKVF